MKGSDSLKEYVKASIKDVDVVFNIVQESIKSTYPKYYPKEVVDFFCELHCKDNITKDIHDGLVGMLLVDGVCVGTGCFRENHITRVYVSPAQQGKGYGSYVMNCLESIISANYSKAVLDASLPASHLYEKRGYSTIEHCKRPVKNDVILVYEVMEKELKTNQTRIDYDGRKFIPMENTENGEVDGNTIFHYHQNGNDFSADYSGGEIKKGYMIGKVSDNGELDFYYEHVNVDDVIRAGKCHSVPRLNNDGKLELHEEWQWLNGDCTSGKSVVVEP
ncbi:MAG: GNAT family N-acetyltransferase [Lachnospiraceae bacterium]|nr:GNAT family N-acetyltransferase [Lachnospiraceae bacterium]